jgi:hypothetical protein
MDFGEIGCEDVERIQRIENCADSAQVPLVANCAMNSSADRWLYQQPPLSRHFQETCLRRAY